MKVYTMEDWERDGALRHVAGQQVDSAIYYRMLNALPPKFADHGAFRERAKVLGVLDRRCIMTGFLAGGAVDHDEDGCPLYDAYCQQGYRYHYLGLMREGLSEN